MENFITLSALQNHLRTVIARYAGGEQWVVAEVSECKVNYAGHCYLELVERPENGKAPVAQARAVIWSSTYKLIASYFRQQTGTDLTSGMKILVQCTVSYHPVYGLSLVISSIDPAYTLGETERLRRMTIAQLQEEGVYDMNRELELPAVVQRLAVVSSPQAAGYRDFCREIEVSPYRFDIELFPAVMQGDAAEDSIVGALEQIAERAEEFDAAVIIRGGGSTSDLGCFDNYRICAYVAQFPLPVVAGIGHDKDISVTDMVAHTSLKTPTAVAAFFVNLAEEMDQTLSSLHAEVTAVARQTLMAETNRLEHAGLQLASAVTGLLHGGMARLERFRTDLRYAVHDRLTLERRRCTAWGTLLGQASGQRLAQAGAWVSFAGQRLETAAAQALEKRQTQLEMPTLAVEAASPRRILSRGYALVRGVRSVRDAALGEQLTIELHDGQLGAQVISKSTHSK